MPWDENGLAFGINKCVSLSDILLSNGEAFIEFDVSLHIQWDTSYILYREG